MRDATLRGGGRGGGGVGHAGQNAAAAGMVRVAAGRCRCSACLLLAPVRRHAVRWVFDLCASEKELAPACS